uniref:Uncharacterized protein n=1 Tax=viral metagenome TaxID=1070528 RepID=A0A2V0RB71_9ZZZZ
MRRQIFTSKKNSNLTSYPIMQVNLSDDTGSNEEVENESSGSGFTRAGAGRKKKGPSYGKKPRIKRGTVGSKRSEVWDSTMSKTPDLRSQRSDNPIKYRFPNLVDKKTGVVTPSLLQRYVNIFPTGVDFSLVRDYWFNNEYIGKLEMMAICYNGSRSRVSADYIGNYFRGVLDNVAIYVSLSAIRLLDERRTKGEFDSDEKFKASIGVLSDYFVPNSAQFRNELSLLKQTIEKFYLPPDLLQLAEETYSPKFSKFAGVRTVELMSIVYPAHPSLLSYTKNQAQFDVEKYTNENKEMVSLFIDAFFWDEIKSEDNSLSIPRKPKDRILNFIRHTRTCLEVNVINEDGEYFGLHAIMNTVLPEYSLQNKLKDNYNVVDIKEGGRFARINNSQTDICKPYYFQDEVKTIYAAFAEERTKTELFGSINFGVSPIPDMEEASTYTDNGSNGRSTQGSMYDLTYDQFGAYHSTRGDYTKLDGMEILKNQFGFVSRKVPEDIDEEQNLFDKNVIQPGLMVKIPDRNGGTWLYTIETDYTNTLKNIVNMKPEEHRWYNAIEQPKYSSLRIEKGTNIIGSRLINADGSKIEGVEVEPSTINDSEMVACYFDLNCVKRELGELIKSVWRSKTLVERVIEFPNGPTDRFIENVR